MKWTVALFGHEKPNFYIRDAGTGKTLHTFVEDPGPLPNGMNLHRVIGNSRRAKPGDVIARKPEKCWNCDEAQYREIANLLRNRAYLTARKAEIKAKYLAGSRGTDWRPAARFERTWQEKWSIHGLTDPDLLPDDIKDYFNKVHGSSLWHYRGENVWGSAERKRFLVVGMDGPEPEQWEGLTEPEWDTDTYVDYNPMSESEFQNHPNRGRGSYQTYLRELKSDCIWPQYHKKKRRFHLHLDDLRTAGVDIDRMLDMNIEYVPNVEVKHLDCLDKLRVRKVVQTDRLRRIQPKEIP